MKKIHYNRLRFILEEKRVPNKRLAIELGVSQQTVSRWRNNITQPSLESLYKIATYLETDVRLLLESTVRENNGVAVT